MDVPSLLHLSVAQLLLSSTSAEMLLQLPDRLHTFTGTEVAKMVCASLDAPAIRQLRETLPRRVTEAFMHAEAKEDYHGIHKALTFFKQLTAGLGDSDSDVRLRVCIASLDRLCLGEDITLPAELLREDAQGRSREQRLRALCERPWVRLDSTGSSDPAAQNNNDDDDADVQWLRRQLRREDEGGLGERFDRQVFDAWAALCGYGGDSSDGWSSTEESVVSDISSDEGMGPNYATEDQEYEQQWRVHVRERLSSVRYSMVVMNWEGGAVRVVRVPDQADVRPGRTTYFLRLCYGCSPAEMAGAVNVAGHYPADADGAATDAAADGDRWFSAGSAAALEQFLATGFTTPAASAEALQRLAICLRERCSLDTCLDVLAIAARGDDVSNDNLFSTFGSMLRRAFGLRDLYSDEGRYPAELAVGAVLQVAMFSKFNTVAASVYIPPHAISERDVFYLRRASRTACVNVEPGCPFGFDRNLAVPEELMSDWILHLITGREDNEPVFPGDQAAADAYFGRESLAKWAPYLGSLYFQVDTMLCNQVAREAFVNALSWDEETNFADVSSRSEYTHRAPAGMKVPVHGLRLKIQGIATEIANFMLVAASPDAVMIPDNDFDGYFMA
jgi:hypothetical protein